MNRKRAEAIVEAMTAMFIRSPGVRVDDKERLIELLVHSSEPTSLYCVCGHDSLAHDDGPCCYGKCECKSFEMDVKR